MNTKARSLPLVLVALAWVGAMCGSAWAQQGTWSLSAPTGPRPSARNQIGVGDSYDEANDRLIIYSGNSWGWFPNDVWVLKNATQPGSAPEWEQLFPQGQWPASREAHVVAYAPQSNRLIVHAGWGARLTDTWVLTNANGLGGTPEWIQLPSAPTSRSAPATGYDPGSNRLVVFGGLDTHYYSAVAWLNDVWVLTNADGTTGSRPEWIELHPSGEGPSARIYSASVYDPISNRLIVHGGSEGGPGQLDDLWVLTHANGLGGAPEWLHFAPLGGPSPRSAHQMAYNPATQCAVLVGGWASDYMTAPAADVWILHNAGATSGTPTWTPVAATGDLPPPINGFGFGYAPANDRLLATLAGAGGPSYQNTYTNNAWLLENVGLAMCVAANAGPDQVVQEGATVTLDGSASTGGDAIYLWEQIAGPPVSLADETTASPSFVTPDLPGGVGGSQMLTFRLTVSLGGCAATSTVNVTVKNVDHPPVADAGPAQLVNEGSSVTLQGAHSYDPDGDQVFYLWEQTDGIPVTLQGTATSAATFLAPMLDGGFGQVTILTFRLTASDGELSGTAEVVVSVEQVNHAPVANPGSPQTVDEASAVTLNGVGSYDPDGDQITYLWSQVNGPAVVLSDPSASIATFVAPRVNPGGATLVFRLSVADGGGLTGQTEVSVFTRNSDDPPSCELARASTDLLWPPNHKMVSVSILGVTDPQNDVIDLTVTGITQDEPVNGLGDGDTSPDGVLDGAKALLRAERAGAGNGRVYRVSFVADDRRGETCVGAITVGVPHSAHMAPLDDGQRFDATRP